MVEQMKSKSFVALLACIVLTSIIVCLFGDSKPSIHEFVSTTQKQLTKQLKGIKVLPSEAPEVDVNQNYLKLLGFTNNPRLYPSSTWSNVTLPVIVTAVSSGETGLAVGLIRSSQKYLPDHVVLLYDLDLSEEEAAILVKTCNLTKCSVQKFDFDSFPSHLHSLKLSAFRPVIIQEVLNKAGAVLWLDIQFRFNKTLPSSVLKNAEQKGLVAWKLDHPTSSLTHQKMFDYFHISQEYYYFHHMVDPSHIILYNTESIHHKLMLPWVQCALTLDCIAPIGAQGSGCRFNKKPMYRYSGCHRYDMSALNVVLGLMYNFSAHNYVASYKDKFFDLVKQETISKPSKPLLTRNTTGETLSYGRNRNV
ncbi:uncharacterized protein LOC106467345 [Limulus polyphemus]|uniref:Uncharacterized protein LOC106467345 n=1 Tax=Limulus polyphemus TaxID=6850 RepID=A0ABM1BJC2_LIMPO|nr:uncharacterized protein LOC106467345 [Limulus polyphemus]XP_013783146.1 uncharacterized protein LOC106467345 [Limulus polyphemus]